MCYSQFSNYSDFIQAIAITGIRINTIKQMWSEDGRLVSGYLL